MAGPTRPKIVPLFQVEYDRTLCKPLGVISDFGKLKELTMKPISKVSQSSSPKERSVSPIPAPTAECSQQEQLEKTRAINQNILLILEFSTAFPFALLYNNYKCFVCPEMFCNIDLLKQHMETHNLTAIKKLLRKRKDIIVRVDISNLSCKICSLPIKDLDQLKLHLKELHQKPIDSNVEHVMIPFDLTSVNGAFKCVICEQTFAKILRLVNHMSAHFANHSCEICGSRFMTLKHLKVHMGGHASGNYPCDRCDKTFNTPLRRKLHYQNAHLKYMRRICPMCPKRFTCEYSKQKHLKEVHNQAVSVHKCPTCDRNFLIKKQLDLHIRNVHLQERNYQCDVCLQKFSTNYTLRCHMAIHTGERQFKCGVCDKAFIKGSRLKEHLKKHNH